MRSYGATSDAVESELILTWGEYVIEREVRRRRASRWGIVCVFLFALTLTLFASLSLWKSSDRTVLTHTRQEHTLATSTSLK